MAEEYMSGGGDEAARIKADKKKLKAEQKAQKKEAKKRAKEIAAREEELDEDSSGPVILTTLVILGVFQVAVAHICLCAGLKMTPPVTASLVSGIEPVLNPILVAVFYGETIGVYALIGAVIVIGSVVAYNVLQAKQ